MKVTTNEKSALVAEITRMFYILQERTSGNSSGFFECKWNIEAESCVQSEAEEIDSLGSYQAIYYQVKVEMSNPYKFPGDTKVKVSVDNYTLDEFKMCNSGESERIFPDLSGLVVANLK